MVGVALPTEPVWIARGLTIATPIIVLWYLIYSVADPIMAFDNLDKKDISLPPIPRKEMRQVSVPSFVILASFIIIRVMANFMPMALERLQIIFPWIAGLSLVLIVIGVAWSMELTAKDYYTRIEPKTARWILGALSFAMGLLLIMLY